ncbi:MAG: hypothetical protein ACE5KY_05390 [Candidatus Tectimicrobiota bacterium]
MAVLVVGIVGTAGANDYVRDAPERVKAADWSTMKTVRVTLKEYAFSPSTLVFQAGLPYKLVITNEGTMKHYFTAEAFFKAIATRKVQSTDGDVKAPYFRAIEVYPGRSMELYFIPVKTGLYNELRCTIPGHTGLGMRGQIQIE